MDVFTLIINTYEMKLWKQIIVINLCVDYTQPDIIEFVKLKL